MARKLRVGRGVARAVYDDRWMPILDALGDPQIRRATDVEWESGEWVARLRPSGEIIARGKNRAEVVRAEVDFLEAP